MRRSNLLLGSMGLLLGILTMPACSEKGSDGFGGSSSNPDIPGDDTEEPVDTSEPEDTNEPVDTGPVDSADPEEEQDLQDDPGDVIEFGTDDDEVSLEDASGDSNKDQDFYAIFVNTTSEDVGFLLNYARGVAADDGDTGSSSGGDGGGPGTDGGGEDTGGGGPGGGGGGGGGGGAGFTGMDPSMGLPRFPGDEPGKIEDPDKLAQILAARQATRSAPLPPPVDTSEVGVTTAEFAVADDVTDLDSCQVITAKLWGTGEYVNIYVDEDVPIDWDYECDGVIDEYFDPVKRESASYGFNNCDLETVASIVDNNIVVNFRDLFGEESDINEDGKLSVVISPVLNAMSLESDDEDDWARVVESYADPRKDLADFSADNPCSDEQEVIYVFAPDPYGFYNSYAKPTVEEFTSMELAGQIARSYLKLISYNSHVLLCEEYNEEQLVKDPKFEELDCDPEEFWINEALAAVGTDIVGFGAIYYDDAWEYLDAPHLWSLTEIDNEDEIFSINYGVFYLFGRWLVDAYGTSYLSDLIANYEEIGIENIETVYSDDFADLIVGWQVAMLASGMQNDEGEDLVSYDSEDKDATQWFLYEDASTIDAPTEPPDKPTPGVYFGANGHQTGFNIRGANVYIEGGTTDSPTENVGKRVVAGGSDYLAYVPGFDFYGYAAGGYAAMIVRLTDLDYDLTALQIEGAEGSLQGAVIRWNDVPEDSPDLVSESVFSPTEVQATDLPALPDDSSEILALGDISPTVVVPILNNESYEETTTEVADTDRWLLDLTDRPITENVQIAIWLQRMFSDDGGTVGLEDPWLAVAEADDVPTPNIDDYNSGFCDEGTEWTYPSPMPAWLASQVFLSSSAGADGSESFDPCGSAEESDTGDTGLVTLDCWTDWDDDGISYSSEPSPSTFLEQVQVQQCTNNFNEEPSTLYSVSYIDSDERDDDELPSYNTIYDVGGRCGEDGEEAYLVTTLQGGKEYLVVVGGNSDTGPYQLHLRQLN
jgi:hypothetical protein